jgi:hypothetical protein
MGEFREVETIENSRGQRGLESMQSNSQQAERKASI